MGSPGASLARIGTLNRSSRRKEAHFSQRLLASAATRFMESLHSLGACIGTLNLRSVAQPSPAASSGGVSPPGQSPSGTLGELAGGTPALPRGSWRAPIVFSHALGPC